MTNHRGFDETTGEFYDLFGRKLSVGDVILLRVYQKYSTFGKVTNIVGDKIHYNWISIYSETYNEPSLIDKERTYNGAYGFIILEEPNIDKFCKFKTEQEHHEYIRNKYF